MIKFSLQQSPAVRKGFTLIEVMVAVSIFAIITTVGIGSLLSVNDAYKKSRSQRIAIDSVNFILDSMAREIRTGSQYVCGTPDCYNGGANWFEFVDQDGRTVKYEIINTTNVLGSSIQRTITESATGSSPVQELLTDTDVINVTSLQFFMKGATSTAGDIIQPFVVISLSGLAQYRGKETSVHLQTSVTQRLLDIPTN